ncbi:MAG: hypothetical protein WA851_22135, partial [Xanthobacteraceae bacterium]
DQFPGFVMFNANGSRPFFAAVIGPSMITSNVIFRPLSDLAAKAEDAPAERLRHVKPPLAA